MDSIYRCEVLAPQPVAPNGGKTARHGGAGVNGLSGDRFGNMSVRTTGSVRLMCGAPIKRKEVSMERNPERKAPTPLETKPKRQVTADTARRLGHTAIKGK